MKLTVTQGSGFTGVKRTKMVDSESMDPALAKELDELVHQVKWPGPDRYSYTFTLERDDDTSVLEVAEWNMYGEDPVAKLLSFVTHYGRFIPPGAPE